MSKIIIPYDIKEYVSKKIAKKNSEMACGDLAHRCFARLVW